MYIDKKDADKICYSNPEKLIDNISYRTIVHEIIHILQSKISYKGKEIRGFVEGATELMALRATTKERSYHEGEFSANFPGSPYINLVSLMAQFEVMFGKDLLEEFALHKESTLLDKVKEEFGTEVYESLRKDMNANSRNKETQLSVNDWQNSLLRIYFDKKIENVNNQEEAEKFLEKLKEMDRVRIRIKGDNFYQEYYSKTLERLKTRYPNLDEKQYQYEQYQFHPAIYRDEMIKKMDKHTLFSIPLPTNIEDFEKLNIEDYKRYRLMLNSNIFELITYKGQASIFTFMNQNGQMKNLLSNLVQRKVNINDVITEKDGQVFINTNLIFNNVEVGTQEMEEIPLNVSKKKIYEQMVNSEEDDIKFATFWEKLKMKFSKQKRLPPYSEVAEKEEIKKSWELNPEEKQEALEPIIINEETVHKKNDSLTK